MSRAGKSLPVRYRWAVASRFAAALLGGYALTSAVTLLLALIWPLPKAQAVLASSMLSFAVYSAIVIWAFHARSLWLVWGVMLGGSAMLSAAAWLLMTGGAA